MFFIYTAIFIFGMACLMCAGAGATLEQFYGWPTIVGRILMAVLVLVTILLGLRKTKTADYLPAIFLPILICTLLQLGGITL